MKPKFSAKNLKICISVFLHVVCFLIFAYYCALTIDEHNQERIDTMFSRDSAEKRILPSVTVCPLQRVAVESNNEFNAAKEVQESRPLNEFLKRVHVAGDNFRLVLIP